MDPEEKPKERRLVIMRGLPGSGKSTLAKKIANKYGLIYSTDDFFMVNNEYVFDPKMIGQYHTKNQQRTAEAMKKGEPLIIIDNTNIKLWEMKNYVLEADKNNYEIQIREPQTQWAWNPKKCSSTNNHGVPRDKIIMMCDNYEPFTTLDDIREAKQAQRRNNNKKPKYKEKY